MNNIPRQFHFSNYDQVLRQNQISLESQFDNIRFILGVGIMSDPFGNIRIKDASLTSELAKPNSEAFNPKLFYSWFQNSSIAEEIGRAAQQATIDSGIQEKSKHFDTWIIPLNDTIKRLILELKDKLQKSGVYQSFNGSFLSHLSYFIPRDFAIVTDQKQYLHTAAGNSVNRFRSTIELNSDGLFVETDLAFTFRNKIDYLDSSDDVDDIAILRWSHVTDHTGNILHEEDYIKTKELLSEMEKLYNLTAFYHRFERLKNSSDYEFKKLVEEFGLYFKTEYGERRKGSDSTPVYKSVQSKSGLTLGSYLFFCGIRMLVNGMKMNDKRNTTEPILY